MSNTVIFKDAKIWRNDHDGQNGKFYTYNISISKKNKDESWSNASLKVKFSQNANAPQKISNGAMADLEGFLTVDTYKTKDGKEVNRPMLMCMSLNLHDDEEEFDNFSVAMDEIPF